MRPWGRRPDEYGFTLVELLVVILVVGILAAIAIPLFLHQRTKAWDIAVASDLRNAAIAQDAYLTAGSAGQYAATVPQLVSLGFRPSSERNYFGSTFTIGITLNADKSYCMIARSQSGEYLAYGSIAGEAKGDSPIDPTSCT